MYVCQSIPLLTVFSVTQQIEDRKPPPVCFLSPIYIVYKFLVSLHFPKGPSVPWIKRLICLLPSPHIRNPRGFRTLIQPASSESPFYYKIPPIATNKGANTNDTMVISLIRILMDGPAVSLKGSPTVSPTTAAL